MSRDIKRRSYFSGLASSDLIQETIASISALEVMPVLDNMNGTLIYIEQTKAIYAYHSTATDTADGVSIVEPANSVGRWFLVSSAASAQNTQGTADRWVDPTHSDPTEDIVVLSEWEVRRGNLTIDGTLTVDSGGDVYIVDGTEEYRPDFYQSNHLPEDTWRSIPQQDHLVMHTTGDKPFIVDGHLNVHGDLICINFLDI